MKPVQYYDVDAPRTAPLVAVYGDIEIPKPKVKRVKAPKIAPK